MTGTKPHPLDDSYESLKQRKNEIIAKQQTDLEKELSHLREENARLREGLKRLEWLHRSAFDEYVICPACKASAKFLYSNAHMPDCWLSALLKDEGSR